MTQQTRTNLKAKFETGDKPTQTDYVDLIDSGLQLADSTAQSITSPVVVAGSLGITTKVSASEAKFTGTVSASSMFINDIRGVDTVSAQHITTSGATFLGELSAERINVSSLEVVTSANFRDDLDIAGVCSGNQSNWRGFMNVQGQVSAEGGLDVSGATKMAIVSAASITTSGAARIEGQATFLSELVVSTAAGKFADVTALATAIQSAPAWAELSAVDTWLRVNVCGRNLAIPLISASF